MMDHRANIFCEKKAHLFIDRGKISYPWVQRGICQKDLYVRDSELYNVPHSNFTRNIEMFHMAIPYNAVKPGAY